MLVQAWPDHPSFLYNLISNNESQFCCIKLAIANEANLRLKDIMYSTDLSTALFFCLFDVRPTMTVIQGEVKITDVSFTSSKDQNVKIEFKTEEKPPSEVAASTPKAQEASVSKGPESQVPQTKVEEKKPSRN